MKTTKLFTVALAALLLASCGVNTPANSVEQFFSAISNSNAEAAKNVSTQASHKYVDAKLGKTLVPTNIECVENGNEANCACLINNDKQEINVQLIDGAWKVNQELGFFDQLLNSDFVNGIKNIKSEDIDNAISNGVENIDSLSDKVQGVVNDINSKKEQLEATAEKAVEKLSNELKEVETILEKELETK